VPRCPSCFTPLTRVVEEEIKSAVCGNCFGTWINAGALLRRTQLDVREANQAKAGNATSAASLEDLAQVVQESNSQAMLRCAECGKPMTKGKFHPLIPVVVDRCNPCGYIWLDAGEMMLVRKLYAELMTTDDPEITRRRDKVATVAAQWQEQRISLREAQQAAREENRHFHKDAFDVIAYLMRAV
jgi:Zn-finger nucleic acid-binding protein